MPRAGGRPYLVIFAAERAADLESRAGRKLAAKGADAVVANPIDEAGVGMETAANRAVRALASAACAASSRSQAQGARWPASCCSP